MVGAPSNTRSLNRWTSAFASHNSAWSRVSVILEFQLRVTISKTNQNLILKHWLEFLLRILSYLSPVITNESGAW